MVSLGTWFVGMAVAAVMGLAIRKIYMDRKNGKGCGGCCDGCASCPGREEL